MRSKLKILVIGASARAAAQSAQRAGLEVAALDIFIDRDLREIAECEAVQQYPDSIVGQAKRWPDRSILLCGGMENYPEIVSELEHGHTILGPNASQIRALRSLVNWKNWVANLASDDWLRFPTTRIVAETEKWGFDTTPIDAIDPWLWKNRRSAGGMQVFRSSDHGRHEKSDGYLQRYIAGPVLGITFCCIPDKTSILGVMRNLTVGEANDGDGASSNKTPFLYAGTMGPFPIERDIALRLTYWINKIAMSIDYRGVLQADFVLGDQGHLYLLEFNPRWTASMEVIELCFRKNLVQEHLRARSQQPNHIVATATCPGTSNVQALKLILYAERTFTVSQAYSDAMMERSKLRTDFRDRTKNLAGWADIPNPGTLIEAGAPVATVWALRPTPRNASIAERVHEGAPRYELWPEIEELLKTLPAGS